MEGAVRSCSYRERRRDRPASVRGPGCPFGRDDAVCGRKLNPSDGGSVRVEYQRSRDGALGGRTSEVVRGWPRRELVVRSATGAPSRCPGPDLSERRTDCFSGRAISAGLGEGHVERVRNPRIVACARGSLRPVDVRAPTLCARAPARFGRAKALARSCVASAREPCPSRPAASLHRAGGCERMSFSPVCVRGMRRGPADSPSNDH